MDGRRSDISPPKLISALRGYDLLPAIVFLPTRRKCDEAASEVAANKGQQVNAQKYLQRQELFESFAEKSPEVRRHRHAKILVNSGVASHHAGHIPSWKLLVEKMMSTGLLNAIFATSTVAAGVDFPARTVVITNADTRGNDGWRPLSANELHQMTGRAGRRGKDLVGFCVLAPGQFQNVKRIAELLKAKPDPIQSKFRATYTTLLNLLDAFGSFDHVREIAEKSFAHCEIVKQIAAAERSRSTAEKQISEVGVNIADARGLERLLSARKRLEHRPRATRAELRHRWLQENVISGRIVTRGRNGKRLFLVISVHGETVNAMRDDGKGTTLSLSSISRVYSKTYSISDPDVETAFIETIEGKNSQLAEPKLSLNPDNEGSLAILDDRIAEFTKRDPDKSRGSSKLFSLSESAAAIEEAERNIERLRERVWEPFRKRACVLEYFGYIDAETEQVTDTGKWLADLRIDRPLLAGEALRKGLLDDLRLPALAGLFAALTADPERDYGDLYCSDELLDVIADLEETIFEVSRIEMRLGIEPADELNLSAAAAAEFWVRGNTWASLVNKTQAEEGDLVRLLSRTGEALRQVAQLKNSNAKAAKLAGECSEIILRAPIK